ncbi:MAG: hypothetical protein JF622_08265, partial [Terrabacter sp.]|nr:hypothetical protein [Terrabacter sp.]
MSHVHDGGHASAAIPGDVALPLPTGDASELRAAARSLDRAASRARATTTVQGTLGPRLSAVWTGDAATAAHSEADELGGRARRVVDALPVASRSLLTYAAALDQAVTRVRSLQRQWDALDAEQALTLLRVAALPDPTGAIGVLGAERARSEQVQGQVRLSRAYAGVLDDLRVAARRCAGLVAGATDTTFPSAASAGAGRVRAAVTGGLWFADGVVAARASQDAALSDSLLARRVLAGGSSGRLGNPQVAELATQVRARVDDPVYAQALLSALGADGLARLLMAAGVTRSASGAHVDTVREILGAFGSLVVTATSHGAPAGTDPRTRTQLGSGAALLTDDLVAAADTVQVDPVGGGRATGAWLLGQLLSAARASGDDRRLPGRFARRAAAAAATAEVAETRDSDAALAHGTTLHADAGATFASWFDDGSRSGDPVHVLLEHVVDDPAEESALLAEPLPDSDVAAGALANGRGDRITLGEYLVRRWVAHEANGIESHPDLRLSTDTDLARLLASVATSTGEGAAETRARVMLEVSRTSGHAMLEASTTRIYTRATAPLEQLVAEWLSAMRGNVDTALATPLLSADTTTPGYARQNSGAAEPWLDAEELTGVVAALAVDTGMGLHAKDPGAAYGRLVDRELRAAQDTVERGGDVRRDVVRLGFLDQAASAALVAVARRQDVLNRSAWQGLAEAAHVIDEIRRGSVAGLASTVRTYVDGGTMRSAADDLVIALVRSDVELAQTDLDDARRAELVSRIGAITGGRTDVLAAIGLGAARAPLLPTVAELRAARADEIRTAFDAAVKDGSRGRAISATDRLQQRTSPTDRVHVVPGDAQPGETSRADAQKRVRDAPLTGSAQKADPWHRAGSWVVGDISERASVF